MAVTKRLRYEVLRRDNNTCRYCGGTSPEVRLTIDHVVPVSLGGTDDPGNLVAACADCNAGKSSSNPDAPLIDDVAADAVRWAAAMLYASDLALERREARYAIYDQFDEAWGGWVWGYKKEPAELGNDYRSSLDRFLKAGLGIGDIVEAVDIAMRNSNVRMGDIWRYFCGVCWRMVEEHRAVALEIVRGETA